MTKSGYLPVRWYPKEDNRGQHNWGKWLIMPLDENPMFSDILPVADDLTAELAEHISNIHNQWVREKLGGEIDPSVEYAP